VPRTYLAARAGNTEVAQPGVQVTLHRLRHQPDLSKGMKSDCTLHLNTSPLVVVVVLVVVVMVVVVMVVVVVATDMRARS
jgi:hypothetical protein